MKSLILTLSFFIAITLQADVEPNDVLADATDLSISTAVSGFMDASDDVDWYKIQPTSVGDLEIVLAPPAGSLGIQAFLRSSTGGSFGSFFDSGDTVKFVFKCSGALTYYIELRRTAGSGNYELSYNVPDLTFAADNEPNNNIAGAQEIFDGIQVTGQIGQPKTPSGFDTNDYFKLEMPTSGSVTAKVNITDGLLASFSILRSSGGILATTISSVSGLNTLNLDCVAEETLYFRIKKSIACGSYTLEVNVDPTPLSNDPEPNNTVSQAIDLIPGIPAEGHLGHVIDPPVDTKDYYKFSGSGEVTLNAIYEDGFSGKISLLDATSSVLSTTPFSTDTFSSITYNLPSTGLYYVLVEPVGCGAYTLTLENNCAAPTNLSADPVISIGAFLNWDLVDDATEYLLEKRVLGDPLWEAPLALSTTSYPWYPIASCIDHEFRVAAICGSDTSSFSAPFVFQTLCTPVCDAPMGISIDAVGTESATISWTPALVDLGYRIQYVEAGALSTIFTDFTTSSSFTISGLTPASNYLFRVNAYCLDNGISGFVNDSFTTASARLGQRSLHVYPNPVRDLLYLQLEIEGSSISRIELYNSSGQMALVDSEIASSGLMTINCGELPAGIYQLFVFDQSGMRISKQAVAIQ